MLIPKTEIVKFVLKDVLRKQKIKSQTKLAKVVRKKLMEGDNEYAISAFRVRTVALQTPKVSVKIRTKKGKHPRKCPACSQKIKKIYTKNLKGRKVLVSLKCSKCSYKGTGGKWIPSRYEFELSN